MHTFKSRRLHLLIGTLLFAFTAFVVHGMLFAPAARIDEPTDEDRPKA